MLDTRPDLPVVLFTGYSADRRPEDVHALGFRALLSKPMTSVALAEALHRVFHDA